MATAAMIATAAVSFAEIAYPLVVVRENVYDATYGRQF